MLQWKRLGGSLNFLRISRARQMMASYVFKILSIIEVGEFDRSLTLNIAGEDLDLNEASVREEIEGKHLYHHLW